MTTARIARILAGLAITVAILGALAAARDHAISHALDGTED